MKEATGELNATVVVVIAVGLFAAFFFSVLWPIINNNFEQSSNCGSAICEKCESGTCDTVECYIKGKESEGTFSCPYKG